MPISPRIVWILSSSYILREHSFLSQKPKFLLSSPIIFIFGFVRILQLYFLQKSQNTGIAHIPDHIVIKSEAPHMHMNYFRLFNQDKDQGKYFYIECFNKKQFTQIRKLHFWDIFYEFYVTFKELIPILSKLKADEGKKYTINPAMVSLPVFAYFTCLFKNLKRENPNIKIFIGGAHLISASAITAGIPAYWLSHGLIPQAKLNKKDIEANPIKYFIAFPQYQEIYLYSKDEQRYLINHGISSSVKLYDFKKIQDLKNKILIFFMPGDRYMDIQPLKALIKLFQKYHYEIEIKFHPSYKGELHLEFLDDKNIKINKSFTASASELMNTEKPKFVASWGSTTLCEALRQGIAPICLTSNGEENFVPYNYRKRTIWWQEDQDILLKILDDPEKESWEKFINRMV